MPARPAWAQLQALSQSPACLWRLCVGCLLFTYIFAVNSTTSYVFMCGEFGCLCSGRSRFVAAHPFVLRLIPGSVSIYVTLNNILNHNFVFWGAMMLCLFLIG